MKQWANMRARANGQPNINDPAQSESTTMFRSDRDGYNERVREQTKRFSPAKVESADVIE